MLAQPMIVGGWALWRGSMSTVRDVTSRRVVARQRPTMQWGLRGIEFSSQSRRGAPRGSSRGTTLIAMATNTSVQIVSDAELFAREKGPATIGAVDPSASALVQAVQSLQNFYASAATKGLRAVIFST